VRRHGDVEASGKEALAWGINPGDSHPGPQATHFLAVQAADFIEEKWPEALGPKDLEWKNELVINDWLPDELNVRQTGANTFELDFPATTSRMPQLPTPPAALVALRNPKPIVEVGFAGTGLQKVRAWALLQAEDRFEADNWHELEPFDSDPRILLMPVSIAERRISALRFSAEIKGADRKLSLSLSPPVGASSNE
jgi:hypothetical protein